MARGGGLAAALAVAGIAVAFSLAEPRRGEGGEVTLAAGPGTFNVPVRSIKENTFKEVVRQQYDFSCGSAAIATVLTYHYQLPTSEQEVFEAMWQHGEQAKIAEFGFSLLDMKNYLARRGIAADGFRVPLDKVGVARIPAIALIDTGGYRHFVVLKGINEREVLIGDPALGTRVVDRAEFEASWNGILFVLRSHGEVGREHFNRPDSWQVIAKSPVDSGRIRAALGSFTLNLPGRGEF